MILNNVSLILEDSVVSGSLEIVDGVIRSYS
ncbi:phosphonate metabolism domain protein, partial [Yersinia pestis PY-65]